MRILITGGGGRLGRELQVAFASQTVSAPDEPELDVTDGIAVGQAMEAFRPELVIHAAAYTDTRGCEKDPALAMRVNGDGTRNVALACRRVGATLLYVSTNEVFDGAKDEPYLETDEPRAINAYGSSKLLGEQHIRSLLQKAYIVRTSWLYGGGSDFPAKVLQVESGDLRMVTDEVASPTWARDLAEAIARLVERDAPPGIYHLTNAGHCSRFEWADQVLALAGRQDVVLRPVTHAEYKAPYRKPALSALANRAAAALGVVLRPWPEALAAYFAAAQVDRAGPAGRPTFGPGAPR
jgi:dTDP-4-dehydrorhamnose reductase